MRHYEIVLLIHPDQSEQIPVMLDRYKATIEKAAGKIHRSEDWGRRALSYPIQKLHKAHYILLNIECPSETMQELKNAFRYNDTILRNLILVREHAITEMSAMLKTDDEKERSPKEGREFEVEETE